MNNNKCIIKNCEYYSSDTSNKCSIHSNLGIETCKACELFTEYLESEKNNIINKTQENCIINMLKHIDKDNYIKCFTLFFNYMNISKKKYITANMAKHILELLSVDRKKSTNLVHCIYPFVIDIWNINKDHNKWPAVCYYDCLHGTHIINHYVVKKNFKIPKNKTGFYFLPTFLNKL